MEGMDPIKAFGLIYMLWKYIWAQYIAVDDTSVIIDRRYYNSQLLWGCIVLVMSFIYKESVIFYTIMALVFIGTESVVIAVFQLRALKHVRLLAVAIIVALVTGYDKESINKEAIASVAMPVMQLIILVLGFITCTYGGTYYVTYYFDLLGL